MVTTVGQLSMSEEHFRQWVAGYLSNGRLALILGSGISFDSGLPKWEDLINRLYLQKKEPKPPGEDDLTILAEHFREHICQGNTEDFLNCVQKALYTGYHHNLEQLKANALLSAISGLITESKRGSAAYVVTFNYDDLLEQHLQFDGRIVDAVIESAHWLNDVDAAIHHPHGYLPLDEDNPRSRDIILDRLSYGRAVGDRGSAKSWWFEIFTIMRTHFCLFIGLDIKDRGVDDYLTIVGDGHIALQEGSPAWGVAFKERPSVAQKLMWRRRGIFVKSLESYGDLPEVLRNIAQTAAKK